MLMQYAIEQGWEIFRIYSDDDYAGADRRRPEFNRLLQDAEARKFDIVLCKTQSRFTRELELVEKYIHGLFPIWGIRFISIVDNADTANKGNKKSRQINGLVNEWYLEDMSDNIRSVLKNRRENGFHIGSFALYGYKKDPDQKGHLLIDEEAAAVVREVFTLFSQGYGKTAIARMLNDRGIPNPTEYKRQKGLRYKQPKAKNSTLWKYFAISDMLVNEIYIGNMVQGKYGSVSYKTKQNKPRPKSQWYIVEGTHEPIIDRELWDRVQKMVQQRAKPFNIGTIGLFARKARCANCGYVMRSSKNRGKHYLQCSNHHVAKDACVGSYISVDKLEQMVIDELNRLSKEYLNKDDLERKIVFCNNLQAQKDSIRDDKIHVPGQDPCAQALDGLIIALYIVLFFKICQIRMQKDGLLIGVQFLFPGETVDDILNLLLRKQIAGVEQHTGEANIGRRGFLPEHSSEPDGYYQNHNDRPLVIVKKVACLFLKGFPFYFYPIFLYRVK